MISTIPFRSYAQSNPESGQGLVEYALILALVAVVVIGILVLTGPAIETIYLDVAIALNDDQQHADLATEVENCVTDPGAKNPLLSTIARQDITAFKAQLEVKKAKMSADCYTTLKSLANSI